MKDVFLGTFLPHDEFFIATVYAREGSGTSAALEPVSLQTHERGIQPPPAQSLPAGGAACPHPIPPGTLTWDGHVPDQDRVEKAGHGQQHVGQKPLEAAQPVSLLLCSVGQGPWLTPEERKSRIGRK